MHNKFLNKNAAWIKCVTKIIPQYFLQETMYDANIRISKKAFVHIGATVKSFRGGHCRIGDNCTVHKGAMIITQGGDITIGKNCSVNPYTVIYGTGGLEIHDNVRIATHVVIIPANHVFDGVDPEIGTRGQVAKGICIESGVWIGAGARILDGVRIRRGTVIGAGAVVTSSTEEGGVYVGIPARLLRIRR